MPNITLYHASPSRSSIVLWMLEEVGQPYDIKLIRLSAGDNLKPDYLAINPMGKVPTLKHGDTVITEGAAICTYLADEISRQEAEYPGWQHAARRISQVAVLRAERDRAGDDRPCIPAQGKPARLRAWLARFRHRARHREQCGCEKPLSDGRAVHRRRRRDRFRPSLRHDVQDDSRAERISGLRRAHSTA